jgi:H+/Cl- antiporter ClcA
VLGVVSGLLGSFFISVNTKVNAQRAKILTKSWHKPIDTFIFCFLSASCFYAFPYWFETCVPRTVLENNLQVELQLSLEQVLDSEENTTVYRGWCRDPDTFNPIVSIFWQTEGGLIRDILSESVMCSLTQMVIFCAVWYFWTIVTYGTNVPSGLFLPGMIIGCALGEIYAHICLDLEIYDMDHYIKYRVIYIILGMGAMLASYTRMTYSLAVIVMETSQAINIFFPVIITIAIANAVGA